MLDFYAIDDLRPFPAGMPAGARFLGGMDIDVFHACAAVLETCLAPVGVKPSYFDDWVISAEDLESVAGLVDRATSEAAVDAQPGLAKFSAMLGLARGKGLLAVCD